ncbi:uncharacterized protein LOC135937512 [Cloeon dipterum]|uniref:uncharacterized protein LOC135937512 n=1 Tax=Cloeon dipterum TaxID=197152 RepID=UPI0032203868
MTSNSDNAKRSVENFFDCLTGGNTPKKPFIDSSDKKNGSSPLDLLNGFLSGITGAKHIPSKYVLLTAEQLSRSRTTTFGILSGGQWLLRLDNAHRGTPFSHVNINPKLTSIPDPHLPLPAGVTTLGAGATKICNVVGKVALPIALTVDTVRVGCAIGKDIKQGDTYCHQTVKTVSSTASSWAGGFGGAFAGNSVGSLVGGGIGALFGGVGAAPGAAIGALVGSLVGGVSGGIGAGIAAEAVVNKLTDVHGIVSITNKGHIVMTSSFPPETNAHKNEWLQVVQSVVQTALENRQMCVITYQTPEEIFTGNYCDLLEPQDVESEFGLFMSKATITKSLVEKACDSLHFFCSFLAFVDCNFELSKLEKLIGSTGEKMSEIANEFICMNSDGSALYWINPHNGAKQAANLLAENVQPILRVQKNS